MQVLELRNLNLFSARLSYYFFLWKKVKIKFILEQAMKTQRGSRGRPIKW
jgi:hypothetical protein